MKGKFIATVIFFLFILFGLYFFNKHYHLARVTSNSMESTFKENNRLLYQKIDRNNPEIKHNDIVLFKQYGSTYIKRIIGLPCDTLKIKNNKVFINNQAHHEVETLQFKGIHYATKDTLP